MDQQDTTPCIDLCPVLGDRCDGEWPQSGIIGKWEGDWVWIKCIAFQAYYPEPGWSTAPTPQKMIYLKKWQRPIPCKGALGSKG